MRSMCAMWASEWHFGSANVFAPLRERNLQIDTIPKPGGLGFESALRVVAVQLLSSICPAFVPVWSTFCPARFWALEQ
jgi:hypothetical protein